MKEATLPRAGNRIFILEGPDCSGKTTLAKAIGGHYLHATYRFKGKMCAYHCAIFRKAIRLSQTSHVVIDRWRLSEIVYGNVFRGGPEQPEESYSFFNLAKHYGAKHIICLPHDKAKHRRTFHKISRTRDEMYDDVSEVYDEYERNLNTVDHYRYDFFERSASIRASFFAAREITLFKEQINGRR